MGAGAGGVATGAGLGELAGALKNVIAGIALSPSPGAAVEDIRTLTIMLGVAVAEVDTALKAVGTKAPAARRVSSLSMLIAGDQDMRSINRSFRRHNRTTDVLTFPAGETYGVPGSPGRPLGDLVISIDQARRQARGRSPRLW